MYNDGDGDGDDDDDDYDSLDLVVDIGFSHGESCSHEEDLGGSHLNLPPPSPLPSIMVSASPFLPSSIIVSRSP